ncbi:tRNA methyltransferase, partial [Staphylococcus simulans]|uniref:tRNA (adenine(22)-N(1))-methyltransferase TrmK n=1 Tax=Staphylococcus simulans TaxID=1286 RepID=UPI000FF0CEE5
NEEIMEEKGHRYEIIFAEYFENKPTMTRAELKFGPELVKDKNDLFNKKWEREKEALLKIKNNLNPNTHAKRLNEINDELDLINEVL